MVVKPLLPLLGAPDLDAVLCKPFHYKRRLVINPADTVKHEYQKDVKFAFQCRILKLLYGIPVLCGDLVAGYPFFGIFLHDLPVLLIACKIMARRPLHRDVVLILIVPVHLLFR